MIHPDLYQEITRLAESLKAKFSPPEFIPGCQVKSVTDVSLYATNNGWIEAICGQHNQQRVRWKSTETVAVNDYIDVLYFPDRRLFEAYGLGGAGAITPAGGNVWPKADQNLLDGVNYTTVALLIAAMGSGDIGYLGERVSVEAVTLDQPVTLRGVGASATVFQSTFTITNDTPSRVREIGIDSSGANARGFDVNINGSCILEDCEASCFGTTTSRALDVSTPSAGATVTVIGGRYEGIGTLPFDVYADTDATIELRGPVLVNKTIGGPGDVTGYYYDDAGNIYFVPATGRVLGVWLEDISTGLRTYYSTIAAAITAAAAGDIIWLEAGTYSVAVTLNKDVTLKGSARGDTIITQGGSGVTTLTVSTSGARVEDITVIHSGAGNAIDVTAAIASLERVIAQTIAATGTFKSAIAVTSATKCTLIDCEATASGGSSTDRGLFVTSSGICEVYGGIWNGADVDAEVSSGSICTLNNVILVNDTATGAFRGTHLGVAVYHDTTQAISNNTTTVLAFNSERRDDSAFHDTATNNSRLTVPTAMPGWYLITGNVEFEGNVTGVRQVGIQLNGATVIALNLQQAALAGTITRVNVSTVYYLAATDYVQLIVYQNSGISLNINSTAQSSPEFRMVRIR